VRWKKTLLLIGKNVDRRHASSRQVCSGTSSKNVINLALAAVPSGVFLKSLRRGQRRERSENIIQKIAILPARQKITEGEE